MNKGAETRCPIGSVDKLNIRTRSDRADSDDEIIRPTLSPQEKAELSSIKYSDARRDALISEETYSKTVVAVEKRMKDYLIQEKILKEVVALKDKHFVELHEECVRLTGRLNPELTQKARMELEQEEAKYAAFKAEFENFKTDSEKLIKELLAVKTEKERNYQYSLMSTDDRKIAKLKESAQSLRYSALKLDEEVFQLQEEFNLISDDCEAVKAHEIVLNKIKEAEAAWLKALSSFKLGVDQVSIPQRDWWIRAGDNVQNSYLIKVAEGYCQEAKKSECISRLAEAKFNESCKRSNTAPDTELWRAALSGANNSCFLWHTAADFIRSKFDDINEVFVGWWRDKITNCVEQEAYWANVASTLEDRIEVLTPLCSPDKDSEVGTSRDNMTSDKENELSISWNTDVGEDEYRDVAGDLLASVAVNSSRQEIDYSRRSRCDTVDFNDMEDEMRKSTLVKEHKQRFFFGKYFRSTSTRTSRAAIDTKTEIESLAEEEEEERRQLRFAHNSLMSSDMVARQEDAISTSFREANVARAALLHYYNHSSGLSALPGFMGTKIAHAIYVNKTAVKKYSSIVKAQALEDSKQPAAEANRRLQSWKARIQVDELVVAHAKDVSDQAEANELALPYKIKFQRNFVRTQSLLEADIAAVRAAWPGSV